jgi:O-antigen ligase
MHFVPALQITARELIVENGHAISAYAYLLNRSISVLALLFWPTLFIIDRLAIAPARRRWLLLALLPAATAILGSAHATSKMAFLGAAALFGLSRYFPQFASRLTLGAWVAAMLLVVPLAAASYAAKFYQVSWLPMSAQQRIVIWGYTSGQIGKAPILGSGIGSARALNELENPDVPRAPGTDFELTTHVHSHNAYLQIWFEAGAVGALLFLLSGVLVLHRCAAAPTVMQPYLFSSFAAGALLAASSFSVWAPWLLASFAMTAIFVGLALALAPSALSQGPSHARY